MIGQLLIIAWTLWTHAQGWTDPIEVIDHWGSSLVKQVCVTPNDHIHQAWAGFENAARVGYNIVSPCGAILVQDQMISNDVFAGYPQMASLGSDSVVVMWQESSYFWFQVRDGDGNIVTPTTQLPVPPSSRIRYDFDCDSLKRIHLVCAQIVGPYDEFVLYTVHDIDGTSLFEDTVPGDSFYDPNIHIDGNRIHIKYEAYPPWRTMYVQYDLDGNITVDPVMLFDDGLGTANFAAIRTDSNGDPLILIHKNLDDPAPAFFALYKLGKETGDILINGITIGQGVSGCSIDNDIPVFEPLPGGESFYAAWLRGTLYVDFCIFDQNGVFIEGPYVAYDYTDEPIQQLHYLVGDTNEEGDIFLTWSEGDTLVWGYYIVLGWLDHDWVSVEEESSAEPALTGEITPSANPFTESVQLSIQGIEDGASLRIFDVCGRLVRELVSSGEVFLWDGMNTSGEDVRPGSYFAVLCTDTRQSVLKLIRL